MAASQIPFFVLAPPLQGGGGGGSTVNFQTPPHLPLGKGRKREMLCIVAGMMRGGNSIPFI